MVCCHRAHSLMHQSVLLPFLRLLFSLVKDPPSCWSNSLKQQGKCKLKTCFVFLKYPCVVAWVMSLLVFLLKIHLTDRLRTASSLLHSRSHLKMPQAYRGNTRNSFVRLFETKQPKFQWSVNFYENKSWRMTNSISSILKLVFECVCLILLKNK